MAARTEKLPSPEKTRWIVRPSARTHLVGKTLDSPGPTPHSSAKYAVVRSFE